MNTKLSLKKLATVGALALALIGLCSPVFAANGVKPNKVKLGLVLELSGPGTTAGTNFLNGAKMAIKEINANGGILGHHIVYSVSDTRSNPGLAKALVQKAIDNGAYAIIGPTFSGSVKVSMDVTWDAHVINFVGAAATPLTHKGDPYLFRTTLNQADSIHMLVNYIDSRDDVQRIAAVYVNNAFGKGGYRAFVKYVKNTTDMKVVASIPTRDGQLNYTSVVQNARQSNADAIFAYLNEAGSARLLKALQQAGWEKPIFGDVTIAGSNVIELAGPAANGVIAHVTLTTSPTAGNPRLNHFVEKFEKVYGYTPDHNGIKGYVGIYILKTAIEKAGTFDTQAVIDTLHGIHISAEKHPGVIIDTAIDSNGDIHAKSYMVKIKNGKQVVFKTLPPLPISEE